MMMLKEKVRNELRKTRGVGAVGVNSDEQSAN